MPPAARPADRQRLAELVDRERQRLQLSPTALARRAEVSHAPIQAILAGEHNGVFRGRTTARIEAAIGWASGSIASVLAGGDPTPATVPYPGGTLADVDTAVLMDRIDHDSELTTDEVAASLRVLARIADRLGDETVAAWLAGRQSGRRDGGTA